MRNRRAGPVLPAPTPRTTVSGASMTPTLTRGQVHPHLSSWMWLSVPRNTTCSVAWASKTYPAGSSAAVAAVRSSRCQPWVSFHRPRPGRCAGRDRAAFHGLIRHGAFLTDELPLIGPEALAAALIQKNASAAPQDPDKKM